MRSKMTAVAILAFLAGAAAGALAHHFLRPDPPLVQTLQELQRVPRLEWQQ